MQHNVNAQAAASSAPLAADKPSTSSRLRWAFRWVGAPVALFLYLSFLLQIEVLHERLSWEFGLFSLVAWVVVVSVFLASAMVITSHPSLTLWKEEAAEWAAHKQYLATHPSRRWRRIARYALALWALLGGVVVVLWPNFLLGAGITLVLFSSIAKYVESFWDATSAKRWFSPQAISTFFSTAFLVLALYVLYSAGLSTQLDAWLAPTHSAQGMVGVRGAFAPGERGLISWIPAALFMSWLHCIVLPRMRR